MPDPTAGTGPHGWVGVDVLLRRDENSLSRLFGPLASSGGGTCSLGYAAVGTRPLLIAPDLRGKTIQLAFGNRSDLETEDLPE